MKRKAKNYIANTKNAHVLLYAEAFLWIGTFSQFHFIQLNVESSTHIARTHTPKLYHKFNFPLCFVLSPPCCSYSAFYKIHCRFIHFSSTLYFEKFIVFISMNCFFFFSFLIRVFFFAPHIQFSRVKWLP